jgi:hypothetical protein
MYIMKILAISNESGFADKISNELGDSVSLIAKEMVGKSLEDLCKEVHNSISNNSYAAAIVATKDYIKANIKLNKEYKIDSAVCSSKDDVKLAKSENVRVIIVPPGDDLSYLSEMISGSEPTHGHAPEEKKRFHEKHDKEEERNAKSGEPEKEGEENISKGKGVLGKIKYSLGIVDSEQSERKK